MHLCPLVPNGFFLVCLSYINTKIPRNFPELISTSILVFHAEEGKYLPMNTEQGSIGMV